MASDGMMSKLPFIGIPVTLASFIIYVYSPGDIFIATFFLGVALIVAGYLYISYDDNRITKAIEGRFFEMEQRGYIISLDDSYSPWIDEATIESLENHRCPHSTPTSSICSSIPPTCTGGTTI